MKGILVVVLAMVSGCGPVIVPVAVIGARGEVLTGNAISTASSGTFEANNERLSCHGNYNPMSMDRVLSFAVVCSDGRQGFGTILRDSTLMAGRGKVRLADGEEAQVLLGQEAAIMTPAVGR